MPNLVLNGDFLNTPPFTAATTSSGRWIDGTAAGSTSNETWHWYIGKGGTTAAQFDPSQGTGSSQAMKVRLLSNSSYAEIRGDANGYYQTRGISLQPNTRYRMSGYMKSENVTGDSNDGQYMSFLISTAGGTSSSPSAASTSKVKTNKGWTYYEVVFTTGATAAWGHVEIRVYGHTGAATLQGDFYWSQVMVEQLTNPGAAFFAFF